MSSLGNVTFKMAYEGVRYVYFPGTSLDASIKRIVVQVGSKESNPDTYFVNFSELERGNARFVSEKDRKVSEAISVPLAAAKSVFVRLEATFMSTPTVVTAESKPTEFAPGSKHYIFIKNSQGKPVVTYPDSSEDEKKND